jgi:5-methylcytosine-specific restriction endonuclease McrA
MPYKNKEDRNRWQREHRIKMGGGPRRGRIQSEEEIAERRKRWSGPENPRWKGGITPEEKKIRNGIEFRLWREAVFARDNWTCQDCGKRGVYIEAHHIKSFSKHKEIRFAIDNGKTLCRPCHKKTPNFCGREIKYLDKEKL